MKTVGVFFGSRSTEHDISILTAMRVIAGFRALPGYQAIPVYISRNGEWFSGRALGDIAFFRQPRLDAMLRPHAVDSFLFQNRALVLRPRPRFFTPRREIRIDLAFPCVHGSFGEDGTIQGLFEMAGVPYAGCGVRASALAMSKIHTRRLLHGLGIPGVPTAVINREEFCQNKEEATARAARELTFPMFVKPNALGSSIGVSRAANPKELEWALEVAFEFDTEALAEKAIQNLKEVNVAVIGHRDLIVSDTEEPRFRSAYQTFEEKYLIKGGTLRQEKGKAKSRIPAGLPPAVEEALKDAAQKAYRGLGASGVSRFDFLIDTRTWEWYLGEVNTLPGSLQAHLWEASGVPLPQLLEKLIQAAEERFGEERALTRVFNSSVLQK